MATYELDDLTRRRFLRGAGTAGIGIGLTGQATATEETERRVVGTASKTAAEATRQRATRIVREIDLGEQGYIVVGEFPKSSAVEIQTQPGVRYVEADADQEILGHEVSQPTIQTTTESQLTPWGVARIGADSAHVNGPTGEGTHVAVIDTGIDSDHPDLKANLGTGYGVVSCKDDCRRAWDDDHDHGTHCAGIAGAVANSKGVLGVCPDLTLHAVKVISADGRGSASSVAEGLRWVADQGYDVASMSLGSTSSSEVLHDAVKYAVNNGVLVVAAAGNEDPDEDELHYPGAFPEAIAVGATNKDDDLAEFSLTGDAVELVAPGVRIPSTTIDDYKYFSGTSMATPHVAGAAGLLKAAGYNRTETRETLGSTAKDIGLDPDEQGQGLIDVEAALNDAPGGDEPADGLAVSSRNATDITKTTATLNGTLDSLGDSATATVGFEYWVAGNPDTTKRTIESGERTESGQFTVELTELSTKTTYVCTAFAASEDKRVVGGETDFTTDAAPADLFTIETGSPTDIDEDEAELVGRVTEIDGPDEIEVGFDYWEKGDKDGTLKRIEADTIDEPEQFDEDAEDLKKGTQYVATAWGTVDDVERYGAEIGFTTEGTNSDGPVSVAVKTGSPTDIDEDEAELVGRVTELQGVEEIEVGFEYWVKGEKTSTLQRTDVDGVDELEDFDEDAEDLESDTTYVATPVVVDRDARGTPIEFTTKKDD